MTRLPSMSPGPGRSSPAGASHGASPAAPNLAATLDPQRLLALLRQQCALYDQLRELSAQQGQCIRQGHAEPLLNVLAQRQRVLGELTAIADEMTPYRAQWAQVKAALPAEQQQQVADMLHQVEQQLSQIIQQDERDRRQLQDARQEVGGELSKLTRTAAAAAAYRPAPAPGQQNRFTSQQG